MCFNFLSCLQKLLFGVSNPCEGSEFRIEGPATVNALLASSCIDPGQNKVVT